MSMRRSLGVFIAMLLAGAVVMAWAQDVKPDRAIKFRQGVLQAQGWNAGIMNAMIKGEKPYNKDEFLLRATYLEELSHMAWEGFIRGSDQGAPTKAKPEIWTEPAKFTQYQVDMQAAASKLVAAAHSGDMGVIKPAFNDLGKACGNCHDDFRNK
jgi:cytochrome c556